jgi:hypothetical protein
VGSTSAVSGGQLLAVAEVFPHPMFKQFNNDVALLRTKETIMLNVSARLIPLADSPPGMGEGAVLWVWGNVSKLSQGFKNGFIIFPLNNIHYCII